MEMPMRLSLSSLILAGAALSLSALGAHANWFKDEAPPPNAKPLSAIVKALEDRGYKVITEIEFEDGKWEVEVQQASGKELELHVDPLSGQIASQ
jgi:hypothetical protein